MKKIVIAGLIALMFSSCYRRIGDLNMVSNRNIDSSKEYVLVARHVEAKANARGQDALEKAIDKAVESVYGEYMMNVQIYVKRNGGKVKVVGDVYGHN